MKQIQFLSLNHFNVCLKQAELDREASLKSYDTKNNLDTEHGKTSLQAKVIKEKSKHRHVFLVPKSVVICIAHCLTKKKS